MSKTNGYKSSVYSTNTALTDMQMCRCAYSQTVHLFNGHLIPVGNVLPLELKACCHKTAFGCPRFRD